MRKGYLKQLDGVENRMTQKELYQVIGVLLPRKATPIKQPGVVDKIVFSTLLGSYIPGMNEACSCCNYRSTEI